MDAQQKSRLLVMLWFFAAALSFTAYLIGWYKHHASVTPLLAGFFAVTMGLVSLANRKKG